MAHWCSGAGCWCNRAVTPCLSSCHYHHEFVVLSFIVFRFSFIGCPARAHCSVLYSDTLSVRDVGCVCVIPCPASLLTARVLVNGGSAPPWVSIYPLSSLVSRHPGLCDSSCTGSSQQSPALWLRLAPLATPRSFPMSDARHVYLVDSFIAHDPQSNTHTKSLIPRFIWSHLQLLANCSYPNSRRPSPSLHLFAIRT